MVKMENYYGLKNVYSPNESVLIKISIDN